MPDEPKNASGKFANRLIKRVSTRISGGIHHWVNLDPELRFVDERLVDLLEYWQDKRDERLMPTRDDVDPLELKSHLGRLHFIEVEYDPFRLRYSLIGTATTEILGRDMTNRYFDEIYPPPVLANALKAYKWTVRNKKPLRLHGNALHADKSMYAFEIVNLPLSDDGVRVNMVFAEMVFSLGNRE